MTQERLKLIFKLTRMYSSVLEDSTFYSTRREFYDKFLGKNTDINFLKFVFWRYLKHNSAAGGI